MNKRKERLGELREKARKSESMWVAACKNLGCWDVDEKRLTVFLSERVSRRLPRVGRQGPLANVSGAPRDVPRTYKNVILSFVFTARNVKFFINIYQVSNSWTKKWRASLKLSKDDAPPPASWLRTPLGKPHRPLTPHRGPVTSPSFAFTRRSHDCAILVI